MKSLFSVAILLIFSIYAKGQKVIVEETTLEVDKIERPAMQIFLEMDVKKVDDYWKKYLKQFGKVDTKGKTFLVLEAEIPGISSQTARIVSEIKKSKNGTIVIWAIDQGDSWVQKGNSSYNEAINKLRTFAISTYTDEINEQIKEAEKELKKAEKEERKTEKDGEKLADDLKKNASDKEKLEKDLAQNKEDKVKLQEEIKANKIELETKKEDVKEAQKALDAIKEKLKEIK